MLGRGCGESLLCTLGSPGLVRGRIISGESTLIARQ